MIGKKQIITSRNPKGNNGTETTTRTKARIKRPSQEGSERQRQNEKQEGGEKMTAVIAIILAFLTILVWITLRAVLTLDYFLTDVIEQMLHDLQQIKVRLHWSREREIAQKSRLSRNKKSKK